MADKDQLQSSINKLDNTMNALDKTVKGLTKAFNDMNRTEKSRSTKGIPVDNERFKNDLITVLTKYGPHKQNGTLYVQYEKALSNFVNSINESLQKYNKIREYGWNKDNPNNKLSSPYEIAEVQKIIKNGLGNLGNLKYGLSKESSKQVQNELWGNTKGVSVDSSYKFIQAVEGGSDAILRTAGVLAQARSDVIAFQQAIQSATKTVVNNLSENSKKVSNRLTQMASDSKTLKGVVASLNSNVTRANNAIDRFTDRLNTATALIGSNNKRLNGSVMSMNTLVKKVQKTSNTVTNIQNTLMKNNSGSTSSGGGSSFRQQAARNSDRAKQAGFIALLIPALAKLLHKTPLTDLLRYLALRFGAGISGKGEHPVAGAIGLYAAPVISGAIVAKILANKNLWNYASKALGNAPKGVTTSQGSIWRYGQIKKYFDNFAQGFKQRNLSVNQFNRQMQLDKVAKLRVDPNDARKLLRTPDVKMSNGQIVKGGQSIVEGPGANAAGYYGRTAGRQFGRNLNRMLSTSGKNILGGNALTKSPMLAKALKWGGRAGGALAFLGYTADDVTEGKFGAAYNRGGAKGFMKQVGKTGVGAAAGTYGALAGAAQGAAIGASLGALTGPFAIVVSPLLGLLGGILGALTGGKLFKTAADLITGNANQRAQEMANTWKAQHNVQNAFYAGIIDRVAMIVEWGKRVWEWLKKKFHIGTDSEQVKENAGKAINKDNNKRQKENAKIDKELKKYSDPNSKEYQKRHEELAKQYIKANTAKGDKAGKTDPEKIKAANAWADKMMNEEKYKLTAQKNANTNAIASSQNAIGAALPANLTTKKVNGIDAVAMKDLGLKGAISSENSVPYIAANNAQNLKNLDNYLTAKGYKFSYTSAMGGGHAGGARSHGAGQKVDLVLNGGGQLSKEDEKWLMKNGFIGNGAVGYHNAGSGYHYDLSVSGGKGLTEAQMAEYEKAQGKTSAGTATATATTTEETASSEIRKGLADIVGAKNKSDKQERARSVIFNAVDVTGSLGVWGITQLNNGQMRTGR